MFYKAALKVDAPAMQSGNKQGKTGQTNVCGNAKVKSGYFGNLSDACGGKHGGDRDQASD